MTQFKNLTGQVLISAPSLDSDHFSKGVVLVCGHDDNGVIGLLINKILPKFSFEDLLLSLKIEPKNNAIHAPIYFGGPVEPSRGFVLHSADFYQKTTVKITQDIHLTATTDILELIAKGQGPEHYLMALGYSGWSSEQLEQELLTNAWLNGSIQKDLIFSDSAETLWDSIMEQMGVGWHSFSNEIGHA